MTPTIVLDMPRTKSPTTDFGDRLAALRKARGITQIELADAIGSTQRNISYYENHASYPPVAVLIQIADVLAISTDELLGLKRRKTDPRESDPELQSLWRKFQKVASLPKRDQRAVVRLVNSLAAGRRRRTA